MGTQNRDRCQALSEIVYLNHSHPCGWSFFSHFKIWHIWTLSKHPDLRQEELKYTLFHQLGHIICYYWPLYFRAGIALLCLSCSLILPGSLCMSTPHKHAKILGSPISFCFPLESLISRLFDQGLRAHSLVSTVSSDFKISPYWLLYNYFFHQLIKKATIVWNPFDSHLYQVWIQVPEVKLTLDGNRTKIKDQESWGNFFVYFMSQIEQLDRCEQLNCLWKDVKIWVSGIQGQLFLLFLQ